MKHPRPHGRNPYLLALPLLLAACADLTTAPAIGGDAAAVVSINGASIQSLQATPAGFIRIGVVPSATQITFGSGGTLSLVDKASGSVLYTASGTPVVAELETAGIIDIRQWLQISCTSNETLRDDLLAQAAALGYETYSEWNGKGGCWRVLLGTQDQGWTARAAFKAKAIADGLAPANAWWPTITITTEKPQVLLRHGSWSHIATAPVTMRSDDGLVIIADSTYRGIAEVWTNGGGTLAGINELPLEKYLYGVVPRELPPVPYGLPEAQKAQAVTARTYALAQMGSHAKHGYDLLPTTANQVYGGYKHEHPVSTAAVDDTRGVVAVHNGTLISTLYHSTSGGWTANSEDVYSSEVAYLRGVPDAERGKALQHVPSVDVFMRNANPINLRAHAAGDFEADWSRYHRWTVTWTRAEMATILATTLGQPITDVREVRVTDRADQGRVRHIEFVTNVDTLDAHKDAIRWTLQYFDNAGSQVSLRSTLFFIQPEIDRGTGEVTGWKAYGGGWGHGVGMSQTGAVGMAERGRTYQEILAHYYQGSTVEVRE